MQDCTKMSVRLPTQQIYCIRYTETADPEVQEFTCNLQFKFPFNFNTIDNKDYLMCCYSTVLLQYSPFYNCGMNIIRQNLLECLNDKSVNNVIQLCTISAFHLRWTVRK